MARTLFPDILSAYKIDIKNEIKKLHRLFFAKQIDVSETIYEYNTSTLCEMCEESFLLYKHRGTILSQKNLIRHLDSIGFIVSLTVLKVESRSI